MLKTCQIKLKNKIKRPPKNCKNQLTLMQFCFFGFLWEYEKIYKKKFKTGLNDEILILDFFAKVQSNLIR